MLNEFATSIIFRKLFFKALGEIQIGKTAVRIYRQKKGKKGGGGGGE
jgi:hypothetical protein